MPSPKTGKVMLRRGPKPQSRFGQLSLDLDIMFSIPSKFVDIIAWRLMGSMVPNARVKRNSCSSVYPHLLKCHRKSSISLDSEFACQIWWRRSTPSGFSLSSLGGVRQPCASPRALRDYDFLVKIGAGNWSVWLTL